VNIFHAVNTDSGSGLQLVYVLSEMSTHVASKDKIQNLLQQEIATFSDIIESVDSVCIGIARTRNILC